MNTFLTENPFYRNDRRRPRHKRTTLSTSVRQRQDPSAASRGNNTLDSLYPSFSEQPGDLGLQPREFLVDARHEKYEADTTLSDTVLSSSRPTQSCKYSSAVFVENLFDCSSDNGIVRKSFHKFHNSFSDEQQPNIIPTPAATPTFKSSRRIEEILHPPISPRVFISSDYHGREPNINSQRENRTDNSVQVELQLFPTCPPTIAPRLKLATGSGENGIFMTAVHGTPHTVSPNPLPSRTVAGALPSSSTTSAEQCCNRCRRHCNMFDICVPVKCVIDQYEVEIIPADTSTLWKPRKRNVMKRKKKRVKKAVEVTID